MLIHSKSFYDHQQGTTGESRSRFMYKWKKWLHTMNLTYLYWDWVHQFHEKIYLQIVYWQKCYNILLMKSPRNNWRKSNPPFLSWIYINPISTHFFVFLCLINILLCLYWLCFWLQSFPLINTIGVTNPLPTFSTIYAVFILAV